MAHRSPPTRAPEVLSRARRLGVLAICCFALFMVGLDVTIVNVALPSIGRSLHSPVSGLQWTIDAYTLVLGSLLMLSGSTADRIGRRRTFTLGLALFSLGSLMCSLAPSLALLVVFRAVQAIGGSMLTPIAMSIITNTFTERKERAQAIGMWGAVNGISLALGPVVGGALVSASGWRSVFWVNVPVGVVALILTRRYVPESRAPRPRRPDLVGQALVVVVLAAVTSAIIEAPAAGIASAEIVSLFVLAAVALAALVLYERRRNDPLIDVRFFRSAPFTSATVVAVAVFACLGGFLFMNTLYLQDGRGLSPLHAGLDTVPAAAMTMVLAPIAGWIVGRRGARLPVVAAGVCLLVSSVMLARITGSTSFVWLFAAYVVFGAGYGVANTPISVAAVSGMPRAQAGVAAAIATTSRQVGQTLGVAICGALVTAGVRGRSMSTALPAATHAGWWLLSGCGAVVVVAGLASTSRWGRATALRTARELNPEALDMLDPGTDVDPGQSLRTPDDPAETVPG